MSQDVSSDDSPDGRAMKVNGVHLHLSGPGSEPLIHVLRNALGLKGTRLGCGQGQCGACTVLIDDKPVLSCSTPVQDAAGCAVVTVEGLLDRDGSMGPVQQAFVDARAGQCGYCLSGIVMRVEGALRRGPEGQDLIHDLDAHLCRCGAQARILKVVHALLTRRA